MDRAWEQWRDAQAGAQKLGKWARRMANLELSGAWNTWAALLHVRRAGAETHDWPMPQHELLLYC